MVNLIQKYFGALLTDGSMEAGKEILDASISHKDMVRNIGRVGLQLQSAIEYFFLLGTVLLVSVWFGIKWFVIGYSCACFLYFPRSMALILPHLECPLADYARTLVLPAIVTAGCILLFQILVSFLSPGDWEQLFLGGFIGVLGIAISAFAQLRTLKAEFILLREKW